MIEIFNGGLHFGVGSGSFQQEVGLNAKKAFQINGRQLLSDESSIQILYATSTAAGPTALLFPIQQNKEREGNNQSFSLSNDRQNNDKSSTGYVSLEK